MPFSAPISHAGVTVGVSHPLPEGKEHQILQDLFWVFSSVFACRVMYTMSISRVLHMRMQNDIGVKENLFLLRQR